MDDIDLKSKFKNSGHVLQALFESGNSPLSEHFLRWKLWSQWKELMGEMIATNSEPVGYSHKKLYVYVKNSTMLHHMYFIRNNMLRKIKKDFHPSFVQEIYFTLDRKKVPHESDEQEKIKEDIQNILAKDTSED